MLHVHNTYNIVINYRKTGYNNFFTASIVSKEYFQFKSKFFYIFMAKSIFEIKLSK